MKNKIVALIASFTIASTLIASPITTLAANSIGGKEPPTVNVAMRDVDPGDVLWDSWYVNTIHVNAQSSSPFVSGLISTSLTGFLQSRGFPRSVAWSVGAGGAGAYNSIFTTQEHYLRVYLFLYHDSYGNKYFISDSYKYDVNWNLIAQSSSGRTYY